MKNRTKRVIIITNEVIIVTNKEIGDLIRTRRLSRGWTQEQLAEQIGVSPSAVVMYETGKRRPKEVIVEALADVFNVPKWSILYSEEEIAPQGTSEEEEEIWQIREDFRRNPELRTIHSLTRNASKEELRQLKGIILALRSGKYD